MPNGYYAVILHFTSRSIQLGFAGESVPHVDLTPDSPIWKRFLPGNDTGVERKYPPFLMTESHSLDSRDKKLLVDVIELRLDHRKIVDQYNLDLAESRWTNWHHNSYKDLVRLVKYCISKQLLVSPSRCKLLIIDGGFLALNKYQLGSSIFGLKASAAVTFLPQSPLCAIAAGVKDCIVVNIDWHECWVSILSDLRSLLMATYPQFTLEWVHYSHILNSCLMEFKDVQLLLESPPLSQETSGRESGHGLDMVFTGEGLPDLIARTIMKLEIDIRPEVAQNLIFLGSVSTIPGFKATLITQLQKRLPNLTVSGKQCLGPWVGASLYCSTTLLRQEQSKWKHKEILKDKLDTEAWKDFQG